MANTMLDRIPTMSDSDLASLLANATRLSESGSAKQQSAANDLLPALTAETTSRREAKAAAAAARRPARGKKAKAAEEAAPADAAPEAGVESEEG